MTDTTLVIMAAGMGSRYGGLKQIEAVDDCGHILLDYSVYDAIRAGFSRVVFIVKDEIYEDFMSVISPRLEKWNIEVDLVFQELWDMPSEYSLPPGRKKPWGTAHAVSCLADKVNSPFAVINADDYYGVGAIKTIFNCLNSDDYLPGECFMVGYRLKNTLSKNGAVSRGICIAENGCLKGIREVGGILAVHGEIRSDEGALDPDSIVSMNLWGLTPGIISECRRRFSDFLEWNIEKDPLGCEYYLPELISRLIAEGSIRVRVTESDGIWQGITYREDKAGLSAALKGLCDEGIYPGEF